MKLVVELPLDAVGTVDFGRQFSGADSDAVGRRAVFNDGNDPVGGGPQEWSGQFAVRHHAPFHDLGSDPVFPHLFQLGLDPFQREVDLPVVSGDFLPETIFGQQVPGSDGGTVGPAMGHRRRCRQKFSFLRGTEGFQIGVDPRPLHVRQVGSQQNTLVGVENLHPLSGDQTGGVGVEMRLPTQLGPYVQAVFQNAGGNGQQR